MVHQTSRTRFPADRIAGGLLVAAFIILLIIPAPNGGLIGPLKYLAMPFTHQGDAPLIPIVDLLVLAAFVLFCIARARDAYAVYMAAPILDWTRANGQKASTEQGSAPSFGTGPSMPDPSPSSSPGTDTNGGTHSFSDRVASLRSTLFARRETRSRRGRGSDEGDPFAAIPKSIGGPSERDDR
jgi:hypothetical protein